MTVEPKKARKKAAAPTPSTPGEPGYDWSRDYQDETFMVFTAKDGRTVGLAAPSGKRKMLPGDFRKMSHMEGWQQTFYLIEKVACPAALAISDGFDDDDYSEMMKAWTEWSGTSQGES